MQQSADRDVEGYIASRPGMTARCKAIAREDLTKVVMMRVPSCFNMQPVQRWKGLLNRGDEWSNFCPAPARSCRAAPDGGIWTEGSGAGTMPSEPGVYAVEFYGRRSVTPSHFGHLGQYEHFMIVDRMISVRRVGDAIY